MYGQMGRSPSARFPSGQYILLFCSHDSCGVSHPMGDVMSAEFSWPFLRGYRADRVVPGQIQVDYSRITVLVAFCARGISSHHVHSVNPPSCSDAPALPPPRRFITLDAVSRSAHRGCHYDYPKQPCLSRTFVDFMQIIFPTALARLPAYAAARIICCCSLSARELLPLMLPSTPF